MTFWEGAGGPIVGGLLGGAFELFSAPGKAQAQADALKFQNLMANAAIEEQRKARYADLGNQLAGRIASLSWGPELDLSRQFEARKFQLGPEVEKLQAARRLQDESNRTFALDPKTRELAAKERKGRMEEEAFKAGLPGSFMFGPTGSFAALAGKYGTMFSGGN